MIAYQSLIAEHIDEHSRVLDLGCGDGKLLFDLISTKNVQGYGIEIDQSYILSCIRRGIPVYQGDINDGLKGFSDNSYDVVILSQTLQQVKDPAFVISEMLRVGKKVIVTFPNFASLTNRLQLLLKGTSPRSKVLPYSWDNTPNIRVITIKEFRALCHALSFHIEKEIPIYALGCFSWLPSHCFSNLLAKQALFILSK